MSETLSLPDMAAQLLRKELSAREFLSQLYASREPELEAAVDILAPALANGKLEKAAGKAFVAEIERLGEAYPEVGRKLWESRLEQIRSGIDRGFEPVLRIVETLMDEHPFGAAPGLLAQLMKAKGTAAIRTAVTAITREVRPASDRYGFREAAALILAADWKAPEITPVENALASFVASNDDYFETLPPVPDRERSVVVRLAGVFAFGAGPEDREPLILDTPGVESAITWASAADSRAKLEFGLDLRELDLVDAQSIECTLTVEATLPRLPSAEAWLQRGETRGSARMLPSAGRARFVVPLTTASSGVPLNEEEREAFRELLRGLRLSLRVADAESGATQDG